jgi:hypothetical protein
VATRADRARTRPHAADRRRTSNARLGNTAEPAETRSQRTAALSGDSVTPLAFSPLHGYALDLGTTQTTLLVGSALPDEHVAFYEALLDHHAVPTIAPEPHETSIAYLSRTLDALAKTYPADNFDVTLGSPGEDLLDNGDVKLTPDEIAMVVRQTTPHVFMLGSFERNVSNHSRSLSASLFANLTRQTAYSFDGIGPREALDVVEWLRFQGDAHDWFQETICEFAQEHNIADPEHIPKHLIRNMLRKHQIQTPGFFRRIIGKHHLSTNRRFRDLNLEETAIAAGTLPDRERALARVFITTTETLAKSRQTLTADLTERENALIKSGAAFTPSPGVIFETTEDPNTDSGLICEIVDELYQDISQSGNFAPNYAMLLKATQSDAKRLTSVLAALQDTSRAIDALEHAIDTYNASDAQ